MTFRPRAAIASPPRALLILCAVLVASACSRPRTEDLALLDVRSSDAETMDTNVTPDVPEVPDVVDVSVTDVNQCEVGAGSAMRLCDGQCVNILTDRLRCGRCDRECAPDETCQAGSCVFTCSVGLVACRNRCIDPNTNPDFCGASGNCSGANAGRACMGGESCVMGSCAFVCPPGQIACDGNCIDPQTSPAFCGASGMCSATAMTRGRACASGQVCTAGTCRCPTGFILCGGTCIDPNTNRQFCGARMDCMTANAGQSCPMGEICVGGTCGTTCGTGAVLCGGNCIDPNTNRQFCGARIDCMAANAGRACTSTELCVSGTCTYFEPPRSYASLGIDEPFERTINAYRAIDVSIGAVIPATILFTCNGQVPSTPGVNGTMSAINAAFVTVGSVGCPILRWIADYGMPLGRERVVHSRRVNVVLPPSPIRDVGTIVDRVSINSRGPVARLRPGDRYTLNYNHQWWTSDFSGACPGCIVQANVSIESDNAQNYESLVCENYAFGTNFPGRFAARTRMLTAPMRPGRYYIRERWSWENGCLGGVLARPGGNAVGFIDVQ